MGSLEGTTPVSNEPLHDNADSATKHPSQYTESEKRQSGTVTDVNDSGDSDVIQTDAEKWRLADEVEDFELNNQDGGRKLGVTWRDLTVKVIPSDERLKENIVSQFNLLQLAKDLREKPALKTILESSSGCVRPGEMLLVLGRPGSGCTTLLKMLANKRKGYVCLIYKSLALLMEPQQIRKSGRRCSLRLS